MPAYSTPVDIGNRGLQHCGVELMSLTDGFNEQSDRAEQVSFVYDKLRRAELRRNYWAFAIRYVILRPIDTTFRLLSATLWMSATQYTLGSLVSDALGNTWLSRAPVNINRMPGSDSAWELYFGPVAIPRWDTTGLTAYYAGEVVYTTPLNGTYSIYMSLINANSDAPNTATAWDPTVEYTVDSIVAYSAVAYQSLIDFNLNQTPSSSAALWSALTTYATGNAVTGSDGYRYTSVGSGNINHDPTQDGGVHWTNTGILTPWTTVITRGSTSTNWVLLSAILKPLAITYPVGAGPLSQAGTRNIYHFPANHLRKAPQAPKAGVNAFLGAPAGLPADDWELSGHYIITNNTTPFAYRFIGDMVNVRDFDDMFCEGLGARVGYEVCPKLTQSVSKRNDIASAYKTFMGEARIVTGIDQGATETPEDELLTVRI